MRKEEFRAWLENPATVGRKLTDITVTATIGSIKRIADSEEINIDEEFKKDGLERLLKLYKYSAQDERDNLPNPTRIKTTTVVLRGFLSAHKSAINHYRRFCLSGDDSLIQEASASDNSTDIEADSGVVFGLERDMQDAIRENITQLEAGLEIIDNGLERKVASGFIDIMAKDSNGCLVVIELKAGKAQDAVVAQILGYMGDIAQEENQPVRGIIVAEDFNQRLRSTLRVTPNLELKSYRYTFDFKNET